jgi:hypothetical protein
MGDDGAQNGVGQEKRMPFSSPPIRPVFPSLSPFSWLFTGVFCHRSSTGLGPFLTGDFLMFKVRRTE